MWSERGKAVPVLSSGAIKVLLIPDILYFKNIWSEWVLNLNFLTSDVIMQNTCIAQITV